MSKAEPTAPSYLREYADLWAQHPRKANLQWFADARFGLMVKGPAQAPDPIDTVIVLAVEG